MGDTVFRWGSKFLVVALVAAGLMVAVIAGAPSAQAATSLDGVEVLTAEGQHLSGPAAEAEYARYLEQGKCGSCRKYVVITAQKMPFISRNITMAFKAGKPFVLHKVDGATGNANRAKACAGFQPNYQGSCDEYPFASSREGGAGAHTQEVPLREQKCQGGTLARQYGTQKIADGDEFGVVVTGTNLIPAEPYKGTDIARKEGSVC